MLSTLDAEAAELAQYNSALRDGWTDEVTGLKLRTDVQAWHRLELRLCLLLAANYRGVMPETAWIYDYDNQKRTLPTNDLIDLLLRYAMYCESFYDELAP